VPAVALEKLAVLREASFGERIAEEEMKELASYFVETDQWRQLVAGKKDIVYGAKGSGKSALYSLLLQKQEDLLGRGILIIPAERPKGAPAFRDIASDPPTSEHEFVSLWKLYFLSLIGKVIQDWGVETEEARTVLVALADAKLADPNLKLQDRLRRARAYVRRAAKATGVEANVGIDPATGMPKTVGARITIGATDADWRKAGYQSVDDFLEMADIALSHADFDVWVVLDRLDVAFMTHPELEQNALRALFIAYRDMQNLDKIRLKIFLRTDIWRRITAGGFREASHITRHLTITWERQALVQLVLRRVLRNEHICTYYGVAPSDVYAKVEAQDALLQRMLPDQVDAGKNPATFEWMLSRTQDGTGQAAPRELIHLMSSLRDNQIKRLEVGHDEPPGESLFDRAAFKEALREVSRVRLTQTLYAEYPDLKPLVERLDGEKTQQNPQTLAGLWGTSQDEARKHANSLVDIGFFEARGEKEAPAYWVPFLYRDGLNMVQGDAVGFLRFGRQVIDRVSEQTLTQFGTAQQARITASNAGVGYEEVYIQFQDVRRAQSMVLWFAAAEPRTSVAPHGRGEPVILVGLKQTLTVELDAAAWRIRLGDGGFRWYKHVDRSLAGYRLVVDVPLFNTISSELVALEVSQKLVHALRSANLVEQA